MPDLPTAVRLALERYKALLGERFGTRVCELVLFGSHARGDADEDSEEPRKSARH